MHCCLRRVCTYCGSRFCPGVLVGSRLRPRSKDPCLLGLLHFRRGVGNRNKEQRSKVSALAKITIFKFKIEERKNKYQGNKFQGNKYQDEHYSCTHTPTCLYPQQLSIMNKCPGIRSCSTRTRSRLWACTSSACTRQTSSRSAPTLLLPAPPYASCP